jgi:hypothetical protein
MGFLNPWLLLGTLAIAVPIIIHLLNRFRHRKIQWGAMELLRRAIIVRSRQIQIEDLLLLALRCLAIILLAMAMARPTLTSAGSFLVSEPQVGVVVAVDGSYSMGYQSSVSTRFERAMEQLREVQKTLDYGTPVSLVLMGDQPRILLRTTAYDPEKFAKAIKDMRVLSERLNVEANLETLAALVNETTAPSRETYILTDAQANTWDNLSDPARKSIAAMQNRGKVFFLSSGSSDRENLAITSLVHRSGALRKGGAARYVAEVLNSGAIEQRDVRVSLYLDDSQTAVASGIIEKLPAGKKEAVALYARFEKAGEVRVTAKLGNDNLVADNTRYAVASVRQSVKVLLIDGDPSNKPFAGAAAFLEKALAPRAVGKSRFAVETKVVPFTEVGAEKFAGYDVVVLANLQSLRPEKVVELDGFIRGGGGAIIFLGDKISPRLFTQSMYNGQSLLLPAEVIEPVNTPDNKPEGVTVAAASDHPLAGIVGVLPGPMLDEARIGRLMKVEPVKDAQTILKVNDLELPLLVGMNRGEGKVLMFTTSPDRRWSTLPASPLFAPLVQEAINELTRSASSRSFQIDEPLIASLPRDVETSVAIFRTPEGKDQPVQAAEREGSRLADFGRPPAPGFYQVRAGDRAVATLAVNVNPQESEIRSLDDDGIAKALMGLGVIRPDPTNLAQYIRQTRVGLELWRYFLIAGLVVLAVETLLAWRFSRRISTSTSSAVSVDVGETAKAAA